MANRADPLQPSPMPTTTADLAGALRATDHPRATAAALQRAIDAAGERGGGTVAVPPGTWTITSIELRSGVCLHLARGAVLAAHTDLGDYEPWSRGHNKDRQPYHLIRAVGCEGITIEGDGTIDGRGEEFWEPPLRELAAEGVDISEDLARAPAHWPVDGPWWRGWKPRISPLVELRECRGVVLRDFTIRDSPGWTVHPYCCDDVRIDGIAILNHMYGPNTDGIDVNGCRDVVIADCRVVGCDDNIILKATADARSCERIAVSNCTFKTNCAALGLGAETTCGIRDVAFSNCVVEQSLRMIQFEMWEPGIIENVAVSGIVGRTMTPGDVPMEKVVYMDIQHHGRGAESELGHIRNVVIQGVAAETRGRCILTAAPGSWMQDVTLRDIHLRHDRVEDSEALAKTTKSSQNNNDNPEARAINAALVCENVRGIRAENISARMPAPGGGVPPMHGAWLRGCRGVYDCPGLAANGPGAEDLANPDGGLDVRAAGGG